MGKFARLGNDLYTGRKSIDFVGRRWLWYAISAVIVLLAVGGLWLKGLNMGIEFTGGAQYQVTMPASQVSQSEADNLRNAVAGSGVEAAASPVVTTSGPTSIIVQTEPVTDRESAKIVDAIVQETGVDPEKAISQDEIGASWGKEVAKRSVIGLCVFLVLVVLFIWAYFREWKMSVAGIVALAHDVLITVGVYALSGFEVTPATVTGVLTILGFSLYDTVVVFDKVRENTKGLRQRRTTYAAEANLAVNQTLVRSLNTSIVALIPVGAILYVGAVQLGSGSLKDLALALFVGMAAGAYSSIFIATPLAVQLKELEPGVRAGDARAMRRRNKKRAEEADRYANVPVFTDDMPVYDESAARRPREEQQEEVAPAEAEQSRRAAREPRYTAGERPAGRAVHPSASSKRAQPERKPRSQRGKK